MNVAVTSTPDLEACDREPIHIPGSIQPHGVLLVVSPEDHAIRRASANAEELCGRPVQEILGKPLSWALPEHAAALVQMMRSGVSADLARHLGRIEMGRAGQGPRCFDVAAHSTGDGLVIEFEEALEGADFDDLYPLLRGFVEELGQATTLERLHVLAAKDVRRMTGFDRVLIYRFDEDWNGTVVAESRDEALPSYMDLRFPASDIPAQARALYTRNPLRIISDTAYEPVAIEPPLGPPLDLSLSVLRSVSPVHLEYMRNMGMGASMSISILREGRLWGLIACHNREPARVSLQVRDACDFLARIFSLQLEARERGADAELRLALGATRARLLAEMAQEEFFLDGLIKHPSSLMSLAGAGGAAVVSGTDCWRLGDAPSVEEIAGLVDWLELRHPARVFATERLSEHLPAAVAYADRASGLLAIPISKTYARYVLWFRPEVVRTVKWAGEPVKAVEESGRLQPRRSFEAWSETVRHRSQPWRPAEIDAVQELRHAIVGIVLRRAEALAALAQELQRSNKDLEAFSYSVSHDLRAPFRHIAGYSELLLKRESASLSERGRHYLTAIIDSAKMAGNLVDSLLHFSQMARTSFLDREVDMQAILEEVREGVMRDAGSRRILWEVAPLPMVRGDPVMLRQVFANLLSNAVKYTRDIAATRIEVGCRPSGREWVFFVRDNGIGFDMAYVDKLFGVFQRLHRMEDFEGTGIGLANVRRIVERHGGRTWAEGAVGAGATFFFSLPSANEGLEGADRGEDGARAGGGGQYGGPETDPPR